MKIGDYLKKFLARSLQPEDTSTINFPPPIAKTLGFELVEIGEAAATISLETRPEIHGNPMGTIHGGILCDIADAAIGTAHATTLMEGETFTTIDLKINFFRPLWKETVRAKAYAVQLGKTISYYTCEVVRSDGKLVAVVSSTVMTLRGEKGTGR